MASLAAMLAFADLAGAQPSLEDVTPCDKVVRVAVPNDFAIAYHSGPVMASRGTSTITKLDAAGLVTIQTVRRSGARKEEKLRRTKVSKDAVRRVYATVVACRFFDLNPSYWNRRVRDGSVSSMDVTAAGRTHHVVVHHSSVGRFSTIASALDEAVRK